MNRFLWRDAFRVGEEGIDNQHKKIFQMLSDLHRDIHGNEAEEAVQRTLKQLLDYTQEHFADEEALMRRIDYPAYRAHKRKHDELMDQVWGMYIRCKSSNQDLGIELLVFLNDWLTQHILETDKAIARYLAERNREEGSLA